MSRIAFIAALPREVEHLTQGWRHSVVSRVHVWQSEHAIVACAGMGAARVSHAVQGALAFGDIIEIVSIGWAGACTSMLRAGDIVHAGKVIDARTGEHFTASGGTETIITANAVADVAEKKRLAASYDATAVEMEAATVARMAQARGLTFAAIKAISDEADFELPALAKFATPDGQFREAAFGAYIALRPALWRPVLSMAKGSKLAAGRLAVEVKHRIQQHREENR